MAYFPCLPRSKHHAACMGNDCLDPINLPMLGKNLTLPNGKSHRITRRPFVKIVTKSRFEMCFAPKHRRRWLQDTSRIRNTPIYSRISCMVVVAVVCVCVCVCVCVRARARVCVRVQVGAVPVPDDAKHGDSSESQWGGADMCNKIKCAAICEDNCGWYVYCHTSDTTRSIYLPHTKHVAHDSRHVKMCD